MSDARISELPLLDETPADDDYFVIVDVSDTSNEASGETKKVERADVLGGLVVAPVEGSDMASGVSLWWFDAGDDEDAARPAGAAANDVVIWVNTPSEPTNLGARDIWEDAS